MRRGDVVTVAATGGARGLAMLAVGPADGGTRKSCKIAKWRATADEDGRYCFAVVL
jgi:hypothetical protein